MNRMQEHPHDTIPRGDLTRLLSKVREERGLDLAQYRPRYVARRIAVRLNLLNLPTYRQYAAYLDAHPEEYAKLLDALTINVTQFFRDTSVYTLFRRQVVPEIVAAKAARGQRVIRVWSAGCATGEEPYSLAMAFLDGIERAKNGAMLLTVIGTDIDPRVLDVAKRATYPIRELPQIPAIDRHRYVQVDGESFRMTPEVLKAVRFQLLNLFEDAPIHAVDVVFCRNVFIYFNREQQERVIGSFLKALTPGGYLVLGRSERLASSLAGEFELVSGRERAYRKVRASQ